MQQFLLKNVASPATRMFLYWQLFTIFTMETRDQCTDPRTDRLWCMDTWLKPWKLDFTRDQRFFSVVENQWFVEMLVAVDFLSVVEILASQVESLKNPYQHNQNHHLLIRLFKSNIKIIFSMSSLFHFITSWRCNGDVMITL